MNILQSLEVFCKSVNSGEGDASRPSRRRLQAPTIILFIGDKVAPDINPILEELKKKWSEENQMVFGHIRTNKSEAVHPDLSTIYLPGMDTRSWNQEINALLDKAIHNDVESVTEIHVACIANLIETDLSLLPDVLALIKKNSYHYYRRNQLKSVLILLDEIKKDRNYLNNLNTINDIQARAYTFEKPIFWNDGKEEFQPASLSGPVFQSTWILGLMNSRLVYMKAGERNRCISELISLEKKLFNEPRKGFCSIGVKADATYPQFNLLFGLNEFKKVVIEGRNKQYQQEENKYRDFLKDLYSKLLEEGRNVYDDVPVNFFQGRLSLQANTRKVLSQMTVEQAEKAFFGETIRMRFEEALAKYNLNEITNGIKTQIKTIHNQELLQDLEKQLEPPARKQNEINPYEESMNVLTPDGDRLENELASYLQSEVYPYLKEKKLEQWAEDGLAEIKKYCQSHLTELNRKNREMDLFFQEVAEIYIRNSDKYNKTIPWNDKQLQLSVAFNDRPDILKLFLDGQSYLETEFLKEIFAIVNQVLADIPMSDVLANAEDKNIFAYPYPKMIETQNKEELIINEKVIYLVSGMDILIDE